MSRRLIAWLTSLGTLTVVVWLIAVPAAGQTSKPAATTSAGASYTPARTPWGDPDLQGVYTNKYDNNTPFERPAEFGEREFLTDQEYAERLRQVKMLAEDDPTTRGKDRNRDLLRAQLFAHERGTPSRLTSLVVDPPDGRIPPLTPEGKKRLAANPEIRGEGDDRAPANSWTDRSLWERCITRGLPGSMLPGLYGNSYRISQGPGYVAVTYEMVHETRIIPLDGRPHAGPGIRRYQGDSRGRWEGNTLVVDVTNFSPKASFRGSRENLHLIERFTPIGPEMVMWEVTVEDPTTWTRPWTFRVPLHAGNDDELQAGVQAPSKREVVQYECHEGNYGMYHLLESMRAIEKQRGSSSR